MITCQKPIQITVKQGTTALAAYWTLDESGLTTDRVDKIAGLHLTNTFSPFGNIDAQPGLFSNGFGFGESGVTSGWNMGNSSVLSITSTNGWSVFFWFKVIHWADNLPFNTGWSHPPQLEWSDRFAGPTFDFNMAWDPLGSEFGPGGAANTLCFGITDNNSNTFSPANYAPTLGAWTFIHLFFDPVAGKVGYTINHGAPVYDNTPGAAFGPSNAAFINIHQVWANANTAVISLVMDEIGFVPSRKMTNTEEGAVYNGGLGVTWPTVMALIGP
jgi:hypothetical protein